MTVETKAVAAVAGASGFAWLVVARDLAIELLGVPLQVVLAALTGACGARFFLPPVGFWGALGVSALWTVGASSMAQLVLWIAASFIDRPVPPGALAGVAILVAFFGPTAAPIVLKRGAAALTRWFDSVRAGAGRD